jgi:integrase
VPRFFRAPPRIPTRADIDAVLRVTDSDTHARDHLLVAVAAATGLRVHELVALDWEQLVTDAGAVRRRVHLRAEDTKGNVGGDVVLNEALRWKVARYRTWCARRGHAVDGSAPYPVTGVRWPTALGRVTLG